MPDAYNPRVIEHLIRPRNVGELPDPSGRGESGDSACGDVVCFTVVVSENIVEEVRYQAYGCAACVAAGSALAGMVEGRHLLEAARISKADLEDTLGGSLPAGKAHALTLVLDALHKAFEDHLNRGTGEVLFARDTAHRMGLPHFTLNLKDLFHRRVMQDFVGSYKEGRTPNPCVACNAHVKFHAAAVLADELGFRHVATGHYARVAEGPTLARPVDETKDQTYVLWPVPKELLVRTIFPLGEYHKPEVRKIAEEHDLAVAYTPESQDICFIPDGNYRRFVRKKLTAEPGDVVDREGKLLGRHNGVVDFTVGQRRGIGVSAPTPLYVTEVRPGSRQVVVGRRRDLEVREIRVRGLNWFLTPEEARSVQVRYNSEPVACEVEASESGEWVAHLSEPVAGVAPGQSAGFYTGDGERVVGGGVVSRRT